MVKQNKRSFDPLTSLIVLAIVITILAMVNPFESGFFSSADGNNDSSVTSNSNDTQIKPQSQGIMDTNLDFSIDEFITTARDLEGAPYQSGGKDPEEGFNSSGFVQYVYEQSTGIRMPRIAGHQYELGEEVGTDYLQTGDVVFFKANSIMSGIYLGDNEFMTASKSDGISILDLETDSFWAKHYIGAKRLTEEEIKALHPSTYSDHANPAVREAMNYLGTPYEFGGNSLAAFDCSFFIQEVFRESMDVYLPRVTVDQFKVGENISKENLEPGDVLYFSDVDISVSEREEGEVTHAGIYVGNNYMIHASRTEAMTQISFLNNYWNDAFTGVKRFDDMSLNGEVPLVKEAANYLTIPFQSGGSTPGEGFNTTGFVRYVFEKSRGVQLPENTARDIWNNGIEVERDALKPGDIVFFSGENSLLPGIYIGNDLFMIASESSGVTTRHMDHSDFFSSKYVGARRY